MPNAGREDFIRWARDVPLRYRADVAVIGGGIAGVCAACAAAVEGASVVLVERFAVTGGNATVGGVANWSGETAGQGAIFDEIIAMQEQWDSIAPYPGPVDGFANTNRVFDHEILAVILQELLLRHGVQLLLHTRFVDVQRDGRALGPALVAGASGVEALDASVYVDATGGGQVARAAGCEMLPGGEHGPLPPSMMYFVRELRESHGPQLPDGWFDPVEREEDVPMTSTWPAGPEAKAIKLKVIGHDSGDTVGMTELEIHARRRVWEVLDYYQRGFRGHDTPRASSPRNANAERWWFDHCSPMIGLRETRRIAGDYVLTVDDLRAGRTFEDGVARGVFYLDGLRPDDERRTYFLEKHEQVVPPYQIPLRSLIARDADTLLMAGRCFSADQMALSSARVMTTCAMMGQAAGIAAAWSADRGCAPRLLDAADLRARLEARGANLAV
ncbi:MAG: FAD-dependent oxidoreductase [Armatimonadota bacterium]